MSKGFVVGTGDLSELALGWSTYNADHMSMYNPNCSIPKTLVKFLVRYVALHEVPQGPVRETLMSIVETTISPELLARDDRRRDRAIHRGDARPLRAARLHLVPCCPLRLLAGEDPLPERFRHVHPAVLPGADRAARCGTFFTRFFRQQYKRSCVPDGPKVGTVSLSPRGDWRMPSDADPEEWLRCISAPS